MGDMLQAGLPKGALVIPLDAGTGTWREAAAYDAAALYVLPSGFPVEAAATMSIK